MATRLVVAAGASAFLLSNLIPPRTRPARHTLSRTCVADGRTPEARSKNQTTLGTGASADLANGVSAGHSLAPKTSRNVRAKAVLRTTDGYACQVELVAERPDVALVILDDHGRFALSSNIAGRILAAPNLAAEQKISAIITYPNLVEAPVDSAAANGAVAEEVTRLESKTIEDCPEDPVAPEIMNTPQLRELAFRVPASITAYLETWPQPSTDPVGYHK